MSNAQVSAARIRHMLELLESPSFNKTLEPEQRELLKAVLLKLNEEQTETLLGPRVLVMKKSKGTCSICLEDMKEGDEVRTLCCDHTFHSKCIWKWVEKQATCPLCRFDMHSISNGRFDDD
ncbi:hypothetical protein FRX31_028528 [Thalictrum thalictroides]|uniref:RING-type E3 ubiquitin transferase n=1 Tax=Thalictrum thalictroides TaxID=46969 RepID=A0A7J6VCG3_THATH|nr:hypothetical protein FRX31_028528 [Thalictrum thalictroides]